MKTKKFLKIALLVVIAALFIWTFVFRTRSPNLK